MYSLLSFKFAGYAITNNAGSCIGFYVTYFIQIQPLEIVVCLLRASLVVRTKIGNVNQSCQKTIIYGDPIMREMERRIVLNFGVFPNPTKFG